MGVKASVQSWVYRWRLWGAVLVFLQGFSGGALCGGDLGLVSPQVLQVATEPSYAPMEFEGARGELQGFSIDLAQALAERLGLRAEFIPMPWSGILAGLDSGRYDVIIATMNITPEREAKMLFVPYLELGQVAIMRPGSELKGLEDLAGRALAVGSDTTSASFIESLPKRGIKPESVKTYGTLLETFQALKAGHSEVVISDEPTAYYAVRMDPKHFAVVSQAFERAPVGIAVSPKAPHLHQALGRELAALKADGTFSRISEKWLGAGLGPTSAAPSADFWTFTRETVWPTLAKGLAYTLGITFASALIGMALGLALALMRLSRQAWWQWPARAYIGTMRGTPLMLQLVFIYFGLPSVDPAWKCDALTAGILGLSLNAGAYFAEIFRAGISSIDPGQWEAARALGMSHSQALTRIILPQSVKRLIPPVVNELSTLTKESSLVSVLSLTEVFYLAQRLGAKYLRPWEVYLWAALLYLIVVVGLSTIAGLLEERLGRRAN